MAPDPHGYDDVIASRYDEDPFNLIGGSRDLALEHMRGSLPRGAVRHVVDAGVGTGELLKHLHDLYPAAELHGIDTSVRMVQAARSKLQFNSYVDSVLHLEAHLGETHADLFAAHFLLAYVQPQELLAVAARTVRPGGWLSVATSTFESFAVLQQMSRVLLDEGAVEAGAVLPRDLAHLEDLLVAHDFRVEMRDEVDRSLTFNSFQELYDFGYYSGWLTQYLSNLTDGQVAALHGMHDVFPLTDRFRAVVVLAQKNDDPRPA